MLKPDHIMLWVIQSESDKHCVACEMIAQTMGYEMEYRTDFIHSTKLSNHSVLTTIIPWSVYTLSIFYLHCNPKLLISLGCQFGSQSSYQLIGKNSFRIGHRHPKFFMSRRGDILTGNFSSKSGSYAHKSVLFHIYFILFHTIQHLVFSLSNRYNMLCNIFGGHSRNPMCMRKNPQREAVICYVMNVTEEFRVLSYVKMLNCM